MSFRLRDDRDVVARAVVRGNALKYASRRLRDSPAMIERAVRAHSLNAVAISPRYFRKYGVELLRSAPGALRKMPYRDRADVRFAMRCVRANPTSYRHLVGAARRSRRVALEAVSKQGQLLEVCPVELRSDPEIVRAAIQHTPAARRFAVDYDALDRLVLESKRRDKAAPGERRKSVVRPGARPNQSFSAEDVLRDLIAFSRAHPGYVMKFEISLAFARRSKRRRAVVCCQASCLPFRTPSLAALAAATST